jgi:hypothetical protein
MAKKSTENVAAEAAVEGQTGEQTEVVAKKPRRVPVPITYTEQDKVVKAIMNGAGDVSEVVMVTQMEERKVNVIVRRLKNENVVKTKLAINA